MRRFELNDRLGIEMRPGYRKSTDLLLCFTLAGVDPGERALHVMINMAPGGKLLPLPDAARHEWRRIVDTTLPVPEDGVPEGLPVLEASYWLGPHGVAVFET